MKTQKKRNVYSGMFVWLLIAVIVVTVFLGIWSLYSMDREITTYLENIGNEASFSQDAVHLSTEAIKELRIKTALHSVILSVLFAVCFVFVALGFTSKISKPLNQLAKEAAEISEGDYQVAIGRCNITEIDSLADTFEKMAIKLEEHEKQYHMLAYRDSLTGLRNSASYKNWTSRLEEEIQNGVAVFGLVVLDLNLLKETNDRFGHEAGNILLCSAARTISDTFKRSPVFRIGGDEFAVILQNRDLHDCEMLVGKLDQKCMKTFVETDGHKVPLRIAKGIAVYDSETDKAFVDVFNRADDAMYDNKQKMKANMSKDVCIF